MSKSKLFYSLQVLSSFSKAEKQLKPDPEEMFGDVYKEMTPALKKQMDQMTTHLKNNAEHYNLKQHQPIGSAKK